MQRISITLTYGFREIDSDGNVIYEWENVPAISGQSVVYNSVAHDVRKVFFVKSEENNKFSNWFTNNISSGCNIRRNCVLK